MSAPANPQIGDIWQNRIWDGKKWQCEFPLLLDAPRDGNLYGRLNGTWQQAVSADGGEIAALTIDGQLDTNTLATASDAAVGGNLGVGGSANVDGNIVGNNDIQAQGALLAGPNGSASGQPRIMVLAQPYSFGFWSDGDNLQFGYGDANGVLDSPVTNAMMFVQTNGDLIINGSLIQSSDARGKTAIEPADVGLDVLQRLVPKRFSRIKKLGQAKELGLIAQEVRECLPEAVHENNTTLGIDPMALIALLINSVKELAGRVEMLEGSDRPRR